MARSDKSTNKTSHVLNLLTGVQPDEDEVMTSSDGENAESDTLMSARWQERAAQMPHQMERRLRREDGGKPALIQTGSVNRLAKITVTWETLGYLAILGQREMLAPR